MLVRAANAAQIGWNDGIIKAHAYLRDIGIRLDDRYPSICDVYDAIIRSDPHAANVLHLPTIKDMFNTDYEPLRGNVTFYLQSYAESVHKDGTITL